MRLDEANLNRGNVGVELEMLLRSDLSHDRPPLAGEFYRVFQEAGFTRSYDFTIVPHTLSTDVFYDRFETTNAEPMGALWTHIEPRLTRVLSWLRREDPCIVDSISREVFVMPGAWHQPLSRNTAKVMLPRAKMPNNPSCGVHLHFDVGWFKDMNHAIQFVKLWEACKLFFKEGVHPARYERGDAYTATGDEYADFDLPLQVQSPGQMATRMSQGELRQGWLDRPAASVEEIKVRKVLSWMQRHRWMALNLTKVDVRKDIEFRFVHGTLSVNTISQWLAMLASLIEASENPNISTRGLFTQYLDTHEPEVFSDYERRRNKLAKASLLNANPWGPGDIHTSRAIRRLVKPARPKREPRMIRQMIRHEP
jgi:hypothetical protein